MRSKIHVLAHILFGKPVPTFPGYALASDLDQSQAFAAPMADPGDHDLRQWTLHRSLKSGVVASRKQVALADRKRGNREVHRELWLRPVTDMGAGCPHGKLRVIGEEGALLVRCRLRSGRPGDNGGLRAIDVAGDLLPHRLQACAHCSLAAVRTVGDDGGEARNRPCAARLRMLARLEHE